LLTDFKEIGYKTTIVSEEIAAKYGHEIVWLPPYHPILNPIEEAWGLTKNYVALHNDGSDFQKVRDLTRDGMGKVHREIWSKLVRRAKSNEDVFIESDEIDISQIAPFEHLMTATRPPFFDYYDSDGESNDPFLDGDDSGNELSDDDLDRILIDISSVVSLDESNDAV
jgi:hypothetical protein